MTTRQLGQLIKLLRREGVSRYVDGGICIELGPARADKQDKQRKSQADGKGDAPRHDDEALGEDGTIDDPRAWLEERYRLAGITARSGQ